MCPHAGTNGSIKVAATEGAGSEIPRKVSDCRKTCSYTGVCTRVLLRGRKRRVVNLFRQYNAGTEHIAFSDTMKILRVTELLGRYTVKCETSRMDPKENRLRGGLLERREVCFWNAWL